MATTVDPTLAPEGALGEIAGALGELRGVEWWRVSGNGLIDVLDALNLIRHEVAQLETRAVAQALDRQMPQERGMSAVDFLVRAGSESSPAQPVSQASATVRVAGGQLRRERDTAVDKVLRGFDADVIGVSKTSAILRFHEQAESISDPEALTTAMDAICDGASDVPDVPRGRRLDPLDRVSDPEGTLRKRGWTDRELSLVLRRTMLTIRLAAQIERAEEHGQRGRSMHTLPGENGMTEYRLLVEPEAAAVIDAAVSALSAPDPADDGARDLRSAARRRADALLTVVQRGVSAMESGPRSDKAQVLVMIPYADLVSDIRGAGVTATGQVLSPATVRKIACDARIIPVVLGTRGEVVDEGKDTRLFNRKERRRLMLRDGGCTFPGCTVPPQWCDAHHVLHWIRGGKTCLNNAALLCPRHHTYVHKHDLTADVDAFGVRWHT